MTLTTIFGSEGVKKREFIRFLDLHTPSDEQPKNFRLLVTYQTSVTLYQMFSASPLPTDPCAPNNPPSSVLLALKPQTSGDRFQGSLFSHCGKRIYTIQTQPKRPSSITCWDAASGRAIRTRALFSRPFWSPAAPQQCSNFCLSESGELIAVASSQGSLTLLEADSFRVRWILPQLHEWVITSIAFTPNDHFILTSGLARDVHITSIHQAALSSSSSSNKLYFIIFLLVALLSIYLFSSSYLEEYELI